MPRAAIDVIEWHRIAVGNVNWRDCAAIVSSVLTLAHGLAIATTAEGVETEAQLE